MATSIDIFCHVLPPEYCAAANRRLERPLHMFARAQEIPAMVDIDARLRVMDGFEGYQQVLSLASPSIEMITGPSHSPDLAKLANDCMAAIVAKHPDRFRGFTASLPLNNLDVSLTEAERAIDQLGASGVQIFTSVDGKPVDHPSILPVFDFVAERNRAVWLHPIGGMAKADY